MHKMAKYISMVLLLSSAWYTSIVQAGNMRLDETEQAVSLTPPGKVEAVVIWLHGLGADGYDFEPIIPELNLPDGHGIRFVFPHAPRRPVTINDGYVMRAWYDISANDLSIIQDEQGVRESAAKITALVDHERRQYQLGADRILLAGFSQGGAIVLHVALRYPERLAGVMALSTYVPLIETVAAERNQTTRTLPVFMAHGIYDQVIALSHAQASKDSLVQMGYDVEWHTYAMEHSVVPEEIDAIAAWLKKRLLN